MTYLEPAACLGVIALLQYRKQLRQYVFLAAYLGMRFASDIIGAAILQMAGHQLGRTVAYQIYFYIYWSSYAIEAMLGFGIIFSIYKLAMAPLKGLQRLGMLMFRWAAGIAIALTLATSIQPKVTSLSFITHVANQMQQTQSVLTLCMLLFVCLAIRPMGLSHRSKIFGVSFGLGLLATMDLIGSAWFPQAKLLVSTYNTINGLVFLATIAVWTTYFTIPEPRRRMIILPTTSPFLRWNQISLALGDEPGFVAIGDVTPDMFAPAEVEIMRRASVKMRQPLAN